MLRKCYVYVDLSMKSKTIIEFKLRDLLKLFFIR